MSINRRKFDALVIGAGGGVVGPVGLAIAGGPFTARIAGGQKRQRAERNRADHVTIVGGRPTAPQSARYVITSYSIHYTKLYESLGPAMPSSRQEVGVGILDGKIYVVGVLLMGVDAGAYMGSLEGAVDFHDDVLGCGLKAVVFGVLVRNNFV